MAAKFFALYKCTVEHVHVAKSFQVASLLEKALRAFAIKQGKEQRGQVACCGAAMRSQSHGGPWPCWSVDLRTG